jgi:thiosulfate/3-mercaptopyruvate sulfurtransferase
VPGPLIDANTLAKALQDPGPAGPAGPAAPADAGPPILLDVRWDLTHGPRPDLYEQAHIPGAVFVDLERDLAAHAHDGRRGRHPLPDPPQFIAAMRAAGVSNDTPVVAYDDAGGTIAARAWWLLRHYGHENVAVLDGGLPAWTNAGHPTESGAPEHAPTPGDFDGAPGHMPTLDADGAAALAQTGILLDARLPERFTGATEPVDPRAGHIPGARNRSTRDNVDPHGRFLDPEALKHAFGRVGATPQATVGAYCGSGVTAAHEILALERAGIPNAALYPGSWSEWSNDPARPVATGD